MVCMCCVRFDSENSHLRLRNRASEPEIVYLGNINGYLLAQNTFQWTPGMGASRLRPAAQRRHEDPPLFFCFVSRQRATLFIRTRPAQDWQRAQ